MAALYSKRQIGQFYRREGATYNSPSLARPASVTFALPHSRENGGDLQDLIISIYDQGKARSGLVMGAPTGTVARTFEEASSVPQIICRIF